MISLVRVSATSVSSCAPFAAAAAVSVGGNRRHVSAAAVSVGGNRRHVSAAASRTTPFAAAAAVSVGGNRRHVSASASRSAEDSALPFYKRVFRRGASKEKEQAQLEAEESRVAGEEAREEHEAELNAAERELDRRRNKSRLHHSERRLLHGDFPPRGVAYVTCDAERDPAFQRSMLARFGEATAIEPKVAWPNSEEIAKLRDYEKVLYDGLTLRDMMHQNRLNKSSESERLVAREDKIDASLAKMEKDLKAWDQRVKVREAAGQKEKGKREKILAELREEFGYDVNPSNPQFAEKYAEKEKALAKKQKEDKKRAQAEKGIAFQRKRRGQKAE